MELTETVPLLSYFIGNSSHSPARWSRELDSSSGWRWADDTEKGLVGGTLWESSEEHTVGRIPAFTEAICSVTPPPTHSDPTDQGVFISNEHLEVSLMQWPESKVVISKMSGKKRWEFQFLLFLYKSSVKVSNINMQVDAFPICQAADWHMPVNFWGMLRRSWTNGEDFGSQASVKWMFTLWFLKW